MRWFGPRVSWLARCAACLRVSALGLRQRREQQQIALTTIAEQTKIKLSLLEALERDDVSRWPSGIFRRAFVRAYAHAIGLDPDVVVREFLERHPDPVEVRPTVSAHRARRRCGSGERGAADPVSVSCRRGHRFALSPEPSSGEMRSRSGQRPPSRTGGLDGAVRSGASRQRRSSEPDLLAAAHLCTELGRVDETREAAPLLQEAARILDAVGLIVWVWDPQATELRPALAHGYPAKVLAQLPRVRRDADNATAAAFRSAQTSVVNGSDLASGALVVPLMTPAGCAGVLAIELQHRQRAERIGARVGDHFRRAAGEIGRSRATDRGRRPQAGVIAEVTRLW